MNYNEKIDYSSLSTYLDCPRKFLYNYILHLQSTRPNINLIFGSCYHYGLEVVYKLLMEGNKLSIVEATEVAITAFNLLWEIEGRPHWSIEEEDMIFPKSPGHAHNMYHAYWKLYLNSPDKYKKIIAVESPFIITLGETLPNYIGRQDLLFKLPDDTLEIIDHKTAKSIWGTTLSGFEMSYQTDGYLTAGEIYYDSIPKMTYNISLCQKTAIKFQRFTIVKRKAAIEQFLFELKDKMKEIQKHLTLLSYEQDKATTRNDNLHSFPRTPGYACTTYMSNCSYFDLCKMRSNPLLWKDHPPQGFKLHEWDPDLHDKNMRDKLQQIT